MKVVEYQKVAVLAGWLGSQKKLLKSYASFYRSFGWHVILKIASPKAVIGATRREKKLTTDGDKCNDMWDLSEQLYQELSSRQSQHTRIKFVFHSFSNGGCFLFEEFFPFLSKRQNTLSAHPQLVGAIFDSCPCHYNDLSKLVKASQNNVFGESSIEIQDLLRQLQRNDTDWKKAENRGKNFWNNMKTRQYRNSSGMIPELYIYSLDDRLTPSKELKELIKYRQDRLDVKFPKSRKDEQIYALEFDSSEHCAHLKRHSTEYVNTLSNFLGICINEDLIEGGGRSRSRL